MWKVFFGNFWSTDKAKRKLLRGYRSPEDKGLIKMIKITKKVIKTRSKLKNKKLKFLFKVLPRKIAFRVRPVF